MICKKTEDGPAYCPDRKEILQIIETMQKFSLLLKDGAIANHVARIIDQHFAKKSTQITVTLLEIRIKVVLKEEILPHYQNSRFFRIYANSNEMSGLLHV